jgi:uncharacterized protein
VITGASAGIGAAMASELADRGFDLILSAVDDELERVADDLRGRGVTVTAVLADLREPAEVDRLGALVEADGPPDLLALNAGIGVGGGSFWQTSLSDHLDVVAVNVRSPVQLAGLLLPGMLRRGQGRLLVTSSLVAEMAGPYQTTYNASKAFLVSFAAGLRRELHDSPVTVTTLLPGPVDTGFFAKAGMTGTVLGRMWKDSPEAVAREAVDALLAGRATAVGGPLFGKPMAWLLPILPQPVRTGLQSVLSRPPRRR